MAKKNTEKSYEEIVQEIYQAILDYDSQEHGYKRIEVRHNVKLLGKSGNEHQIDVFWTYELAGIEYKTVVEVKDWKSPVKKEQLHSFKSMLDDVPGFPRGCFVSKNGFQKGAITFAKHHGIKLVQIAEEDPSLRIVISNIVTYYDNTQATVDEKWVEQENLSETELLDLSKGVMQEDVVLINPKGVKVYLYDLMCHDAIPYYYADDNVRHTIETDLDGEWYWLTNNPQIPQIKISGYSFDCYNKRASTRMEIIPTKLPQYLITDILEEKQHLYDTVAKVIKLNIV